MTNDNTLTLTITGESVRPWPCSRTAKRSHPVDEDGSGTYTVVTNVIADVTDSGLRSP